MYHAIQILIGILLGAQLVEHGNAATKPAPGDLLVNIASHVGGIIPPTLLKSLQDSRPIRTALDTLGSSSVPATTTAKPVSSGSTLKPKTPRLTTSATRKSKVEASSTPTTNGDKLKFPPENRPEYFGPDSAKAAQNQYPFDFRNNFEFNGAGFGSGRIGQFNPASQGFNPGFFGDRNGFNQGSFRPFASTADQSGSRGSENTIQGNDGRIPSSDSGFNGVSRQFGNPEFDRFRDFGRFGYDDRFQGGFPGGFPGAFNVGIRQDSRFQDSGSRFEGYPGSQNAQGVSGNYRQDPRFNYPNSLNDQRSLGQFPGPFQGYAPNNFDFIPNQRFQNPFGDDYRGVQGSPNYGGFYPGSNGAAPASRPSSSESPGNSSSGNAPGPLTSASKNSEKLQSPLPDNKKPEGVLGPAPAGAFQGEKLFYPQLDDYSDLRFRPDAFLANSHFAALRGVNGNA